MRLKEVRIYWGKSGQLVQEFSQLIKRENQRMELEGEVSEILQAELFDEKRFNAFFDNVMELVGGYKSDPKIGVYSSTSLINDTENNTTVAFFKSENPLEEVKRTIWIVPNKDNKSVPSEHLRYKEDFLTNEVKPHILFKGEYDAPVSNLRARNFCKKIFETYLSSQNLLQPQPQSRVGKEVFTTK